MRIGARSDAGARDITEVEGVMDVSGDHVTQETTGVGVDETYTALPVREVTKRTFGGYKWAFLELHHPGRGYKRPLDGICL